MHFLVPGLKGRLMALCLVPVSVSEGAPTEMGHQLTGGGSRLAGSPCTGTKKGFSFVWRFLQLLPRLDHGVEDGGTDKVAWTPTGPQSSDHTSVRAR